MSCYSDTEITYIITAHGIAKQGLTGIEEKINSSIFKDIKFYTLADEGYALYGKTKNTKIDAQMIQYKVCNCKELKPQRKFSTFNEMILATDTQSHGTKNFTSGVFMCSTPRIDRKSGITLSDSNLIISFEGRTNLLYDKNGTPIHYADTLSNVLQEIKTYHQQHHNTKTIKIIAAFCLGGMCTGIDQITAQMNRITISDATPMEVDELSGGKSKRRKSKRRKSKRRKSKRRKSKQRKSKRRKSKRRR